MELSGTESRKRDRDEEDQTQSLPSPNYLAGHQPRELVEFVSQMRFKHDNQSIRDAVRLWNTDKPRALIQYGEISTWDTSGVTDMSALFQDAKRFNDDISQWNVQNVTTME